VQNLMDSTMNR